jgi:hypothetical protein
VIEQRDENEVKRAKLYDQLGRLGLGCLVFGFLLQLLSNALQLPAVRAALDF